MGIPVTKVGVRFTCTHIRYFQYPYPCIGDALWCPDCSKFIKVAERLVNFSVRCQKRGCAFARQHKATRDAAVKSAISHSKQRPGHEVRVYEDGSPIWYVTDMEEGPLYDRDARIALTKSSKEIST